MPPAEEQIILSPYLRIRVHGFDIDLKTTGDGKYKLQLKRGEEVVATSKATRNGNISVAEALRRAKLNLWGGKADLHVALQKMADLADQLAPLYDNKNV